MATTISIVHATHQWWRYLAEGVSPLPTAAKEFEESWLVDAWSPLTAAWSPRWRMRWPVRWFKGHA